MKWQISNNILHNGIAYELKVLKCRRLELKNIRLIERKTCNNWINFLTLKSSNFLKPCIMKNSTYDPILTFYYKNKLIFLFFYFTRFLLEAHLLILITWSNFEVNLSEGRSLTWSHYLRNSVRNIVFLSILIVWKITM